MSARLNVNRLRTVLLVSAIVSCLAAVFGVDMSGGRAPIATVHVLDLSGSCGRLEDLMESVRARLSPGDPDDLVAVVGFRRDARVLSGWRPADRADEVGSAVVSAATAGSWKDGSRLSAVAPVLRELLARPEVANHATRVVLRGDLRYSRTTWEALRSAFTGLSYGGYLRTPYADLRLGVIGHPRLMPGRDAVVKLVVHAQGGRRRIAKLDAFGQALSVPVEPGASATVSVRFRAGDEGTEHVARLLTDPIGNPWPDHDRVRLVVMDSQSRRVGVLGAPLASSVVLPARVEATTISSPSELDGLDALILNDLAASESLMNQWTEPLRAAVHDRGLGLVVLGGPAAFRPGGYAGWELDSFLPLSSRPPRGRDLHLLLDRSGSMAKDDRLGRAISAVGRLAKGLGPDDRLQVWPFGVTPLAPIPARPLAPADFLAGSLPSLWRLVASGGTRLSRAFDGPVRAAGEAATDRESVLIVLSDLKDDALGAAELVASRESVQAFGGGALSLLLDPTPSTTERAERLGLRVWPVREIVPEVMLQAVNGDGWRTTAGAGVATRWTTPTPGVPEAGSLRAWNDVVVNEGARGLLEIATGGALVADVQRGAGRVIACATDPALEGWLAGCVGPWVDAVIPETLTGSAMVDDEGLLVELDGVEPTVPLRVAWASEEPLPLRPVSPGRWRSDAIPPGSVVRVLDGGNGLRARLPIGASDAPEFARAPLKIERPLGGPAPASVSRPVRWPFGALALVLMVASVLWLRRDP